MAADVKARQDRHQTIAFTLPISCQICLGKVKQPVLCPNNHAFCSQCMDVWLQRNSQCPACRTPINPANPVKKIAGGLSHSTEDKDKMSNPELRKARFDLLFKEYEDEFERLNSEVQLLRTENEVLQQQLQKSSGSKHLGPRDEIKPPDNSGVLVLNKKLQDAQKLYDKVKSELGRVKQENNSLKDENVNLNRENQKLRQEIGNRSPHRYGRYTVATLEAKIQSYEKEVNQLNKALEKSDKVIEDLHKELDEHKSKSHTSKQNGTIQPHSTYSSKRVSDDQYILQSDHPSKRQLFSEGNDFVDGEFYNSDLHDYRSNEKVGAGKNTKRVTFDLPRNETVSFDLEMPSPLKGSRNLTNGRSPSPVKGVLKNGKKSALSNGDDSLNLGRPDSLEDNYNRADRYTRLEDEDDFYLSKYSRDSGVRKDDNQNYKYQSDLDSSLKNESFSLDYPSKSRKSNYDQVLDDTEAIHSELDELDISLTPDFTDCMKLLNRAEKKVHSGAQHSEFSEPLKDYRSDNDFLDEYKSEGLRKSTYKSDPLLGDSRSTESVRTLTENNYASKFYAPSTDFTVLGNTRSDIPPSRYSGTSSLFSDVQTSTVEPSKMPNSSVEPLGYTSSRANLDVLSTTSSLSTYKPSAIDNLASSNWESKGGTYHSSLNDKYGVTSQNEKYSVPGANQYSSAKLSKENPSEIIPSKSERYDIPSEASNRFGSSSSLYQSSYESARVSSTKLLSSDDLSTPTKTTSMRSLSQSGFGRSPSVDNLFIPGKSTTQTSRFATAEDIPSYKSRSSMPSYSSGVNLVGNYRSTGDRQGMSASSDVTGASRNYLTSSLPPKPVRTRSQSDLGTTVTSLSTAYPKGKGNVSAPTSSAAVESFPSDNTLISSQKPNFPQTSTFPTESTLSLPSNPTPFLETGKYTTSFAPRHDSLDAVSTNKFTNSTGVVGSGKGPLKANYSYTDFDIGVNPRRKSNFADLPLSIRNRSSSVDTPVSAEEMAGNQRFSSSSFPTTSSLDTEGNSKVLYSYTKDSAQYEPQPSSNYGSSNSHIPSSMSLTGASSQMADDYSRGRYDSSHMSSSTSSYLTSSMTSVTSSITYSSRSSSSISNPSKSSLPPTSSYSSNTYQVSKSLDPIQEGAGKGYSYLSNNSSTGDISRSDSFLPEPKKRLFDSTDDLDMSLSPIKSTRKSDQY